MILEKLLTDREQEQVDHALHYREYFSEAGIPGHTQIMLIAKLFGVLETVHRYAKEELGQAIDEYLEDHNA